MIIAINQIYEYCILKCISNGVKHTLNGFSCVACMSVSGRAVLKPSVKTSYAGHMHYAEA